MGLEKIKAVYLEARDMFGGGETEALYYNNVFEHGRALFVELCPEAAENPLPEVLKKHIENRVTRHGSWIDHNNKGFLHEFSGNHADLTQRYQEAEKSLKNAWFFNRSTRQQKCNNARIELERHETTQRMISYFFEQDFGASRFPGGKYNNHCMEQLLLWIEGAESRKKSLSTSKHGPAA